MGGLDDEILALALLGLDGEPLLHVGLLVGARRAGPAIA
jgi:hypothetical protein